MISSSDIQIVQKYWFSISISINGHELCSNFYQELFKRYPHYEQYFNHDIDLQAEKLARMLNIIVNGIEIWNQIEPELDKLGRLHASIASFTMQDYENIFETMFYVMEKHRGYEDKEAYKAWHKLFMLISEKMMQAPKPEGLD